MIGIFFGVCLVLTICQADRDDKRWVWDDNNRDRARNGYGPDPQYDREQASARYEVYENSRPPPPGIYPSRPFVDNNPEFGGIRPPRPYPGPIGVQRPGGVYTEGNIGSYGQGGINVPGRPYQGDLRPEGILTGPIPSWEKEGPFKDFDKCKCAAKFNCNSPGISYGHCDVGKQYCCYSTNKKGQLGGPPPEENVHSIENGILAGPGGPVDRIPGNNPYQRPGGRPPAGRPGGGLRPGANFGRPDAGFVSAGFGLRGGKTRPTEYNGNTYSPENGILVGPGGPFDEPNREYSNRFSGRPPVNRRN